QRRLRRPPSGRYRRGESPLFVDRNVRDRPRWPQDSAARWLFRCCAVSRRGRLYFFYFSARKPTRMVVCWVFCFFFVFAWGRDLGLHRRGFPQSSQGQGAKPRKLLALVHERTDLSDVSAGGSSLRCLSLCVFLDDDGAAVLRSRLLLSGNKRRFAGGNAAKA